MTRIVPFLCAIALSGCSQERATTDSTEQGLPAGNTPSLSALSLQDMESVNLAGELSCSFTEREEGGTFLVVAADVIDDSRADGVMKLGADTVPLRGLDSGGFNAMVRGARFGGDGVEARVTVRSDTLINGSESPPLPAILEVFHGGTELQRIAGDWTCGP